MKIEAEATGRPGVPSHRASTSVFSRRAGFLATGSLDLPLLRAAWRTAVRAHGAGAWDDGQVCFTDLISLSVADPEHLATQLCDRWAADAAPRGSRPFARLWVARLNTFDYALHVAVDRVADEESFSTLLDLLTRLYAAGPAAPGFPETGAPAPATAGCDPAPQRWYEGAVLPFSWDGLLSTGVNALAGTEGASPAGVVLAGLRALLLRHSGYLGSGTFRELLARMPRPPHGPWSIPRCDAVFTDRSATRASLSLAGMRVEPVEPTTVRVPTSLSFVLDEAGPLLAGRLEHRPSVYDGGAAAGVLDQLRTLLTAAVTAPDTAIVSLPPDNPERADAERADAGRVFAPGDDARPVHVRVALHAGGNGPAVVWAGGATGYGDLNALATRLTARLLAAGVRRGDPVAVRMAPGPLRLAVLLGVLASGAQLLWLAPGSPGDRGRAMLSTLVPVCMVVDGDQEGDELVRWYREELAGHVLDAAGPPADPGQAPPPAVGPRDGAYVAFTSGSTGNPKGIPQSHAALAQFAHWMGGQFAMGPGARVAQWVAPEHDPALAEVCATLVAGGTLYPIPDAVRVNPDRLVPWLAEHRITHIQTVPSFARDLLDVITDTAASERLGALSHVLLMGEALPAELVAGLGTALPGARVFNLYGPTETVAATWHEVTGSRSGPVPIGRAIPGRQVLVLDGDDLTCPVGVTGNIVVRSPYVTPGYLGSTDRTAFRPVDWLDTPGESTGWYRTGDLARRLPDGTMEFRGREDFQIKLSGNRIELTEIEASLASHHSVLECAVVARRHGSAPIRQLSVHVVPKRGTDGLPLATAPEWRAHLRRHFGALNLPATFHEVPGRLPRNAAGKVDRARLR
ncbi:MULTISPECIES: amino acid adenylation domain-containing protein [unclassified Streptomyces]|uniref:amino acid adenylation domain-containing protein n=1 Tax=unclassified Streptomyces TaxID=2593676 RepID=UPI001F14F97A|nr:MULTISPECIES: amino acid adenylation domain-containing protein [unclassified Streptomyces]